MKFRSHQPGFTDEEERQAAEELRRLEGSGPADRPPSESYWPRLLVRTNERIDHVASGKAISLSWAARVALPGAVAIIFFFMALHYYYEPERSGATASLASVVASLPDDVVDSLVVEATVPGVTLMTSNGVESMFTPSDDQLVSYLITNGSVATALEAMGDEEVKDVLTALGSQGVQL